MECLRSKELPWREREKGPIYDFGKYITSPSLTRAFDPPYPFGGLMFVILVLGAKNWGTVASHIKHISLVCSFMEIVPHMWCPHPLFHVVVCLWLCTSYQGDRFILWDLNPSDKSKDRPSTPRFIEVVSPVSQCL
jgi:hypothetical protein